MAESHNPPVAAGEIRPDAESEAREALRRGDHKAALAGLVRAYGGQYSGSVRTSWRTRHKPTTSPRLPSCRRSKISIGSASAARSKLGCSESRGTGAWMRSRPGEGGYGCFRPTRIER